MPQFAGQAAIVTGGAMGIGGAIARRLAHDGARVLVADVEDEAAARNVQTIGVAGGTAEFMHADAGTVDGIRGMVEPAVELWGRLDVVVSNASPGVQPADAGELSEQSDIANAIACPGSPEASFITGQALVVDGGLSVS